MPTVARNEGRSKNELDLHGLHVDEAIDTLRSVLERIERRKKNDLRFLYVITGRGEPPAFCCCTVGCAGTDRWDVLLCRGDQYVTFTLIRRRPATRGRIISKIFKNMFGC